MASKLSRNVSEYKFDVNIVSSGRKDSEDIAGIKVYLEKEPYCLQTYSNSNYELGRSIFDVRNDGIRQSAYTMIYVTKDDFRRDPYQNFWRQNALANLIPGNPIPKGCERLLVVLDGVTEDDFTQANPEFKQAVIRCTDINGEWMEEVGKTVKEKGVFKRHEEQVAQDQARSRTDWTPETITSAIRVTGGERQPTERSEQIQEGSVLHQGREANETQQYREASPTQPGREVNRTQQYREASSVQQYREASPAQSGREASPSPHDREGSREYPPVDESIGCKAADVGESPDCNSVDTGMASGVDPNPELDSLYMSPIHPTESYPYLKRSCSAASCLTVCSDSKFNSGDLSLTLLDPSLQMSSQKPQPHVGTYQHNTTAAQSLQQSTAQQNMMFIAGMFTTAMFLQNQFSQGQQQNLPMDQDTSAQQVSATGAESGEGQQNLPMDQDTSAQQVSATGAESHEGQQNLPMHQGTSAQQVSATGAESHEGQQNSFTASGSSVHQNSPCKDRYLSEHDLCTDPDSSDAQDSPARLDLPAEAEEETESKKFSEPWYVRVWQSASQYAPDSIKPFFNME